MGKCFSCGYLPKNEEYYAIVNETVYCIKCAIKLLPEESKLLKPYDNQNTNT